MVTSIEQGCLEYSRTATSWHLRNRLDKPLCQLCPVLPYGQMSPVLNVFTLTTSPEGKEDGFMPTFWMGFEARRGQKLDLVPTLKHLVPSCFACSRSWKTIQRKGVWVFWWLGLKTRMKGCYKSRHAKGIAGLGQGGKRSHLGLTYTAVAVGSGIEVPKVASPRPFHPCLQARSKYINTSMRPLLGHPQSLLLGTPETEGLWMGCTGTRLLKAAVASSGSHLMPACHQEHYLRLSCHALMQLIQIWEAALTPPVTFRCFILSCHHWATSIWPNLALSQGLGRVSLFSIGLLLAPVHSL